MTPVTSFKADAQRVTRDLRHRFLIQKALKSYEVARDDKRSRYQDYSSARTAAAHTKYQAVNALDRHLTDFADRIAARGTKVCWASDGREATRYILDVLERRKAHSIIKSKTMTGEEIHLNEALHKAGYETIESDLGEYIVQLRNEAPYHIVFPAMHLTRDEISRTFEEKLGSEPTDKPEELTMIARRVMRDKYIRADVGISGANFAIAETGMISITENEGNARLTTAMPRCHIAIVGIEKVLPRMADLALFLPLLASAGAGQQITCYNSLIGGPRQPGECDGPEEFHVILLDNRRTELLADAEQRDALHCIRCGACLNVCPIFRNVGGHTYGTTYQGPIGSVITPHLRGLKDWKHLSSASSLCGACTDTCPVRIDLHKHLLHNRRNSITSGTGPWWERLAFKAFTFAANRPAVFLLGAKIARALQPLHGLVKGTALDPARPWTATREAPQIAPKSFRELWAERNK
jgi:L-lactate dehydrogenase complex protein LldF